MQNGNAYEAGITGFWHPIKRYWSSGASADREALRWLTTAKATQWQYTDGVPHASLLSPDAWTHVALETHGAQIAGLSGSFLDRNVPRDARAK